MDEKKCNACGQITTHIKCAGCGKEMCQGATLQDIDFNEDVYCYLCHAKRLVSKEIKRAKGIADG